jgi:hypothetical protein
MSTYRWLKQDQIMVLHENGSTHPFTKEALEKALQAERTSECPPGTCSFKFYKRRTNNIAKFRKGLELLGD